MRPVSSDFVGVGIGDARHGSVHLRMIRGLMRYMINRRRTKYFTLIWRSPRLPDNRSMFSVVFKNTANRLPIVGCEEWGRHESREKFRWIDMPDCALVLQSALFSSVLRIRRASPHIAPGSARYEKGRSKAAANYDQLYRSSVITRGSP
jgi:hypothetical protein